MAMRPGSKRSVNQPYNEKHLVADQPARLVLALGIILSLILGFSIRGLIAPNRIRDMIQSASLKIHRDLRVQFGDVSLSFRRGLMPRFAVIIQQVTMESSNECWMKARLHADEIRLPLSFWSLIHGENPISQVEAGVVRLDLPSKYKVCQDKITPSATPATSAKKIVSLKASGEKVKKLVESSPPVVGILFDQLMVTAVGLDEPLNFSKFMIRLKSNEPRVISITANTHLIKDPQVPGDYLSHASVWAEYTEFPKKLIKARITGNLREGSYQWKAQYLIQEEDLYSDLDLKHIPLSQVVHLSKEMHWLGSDMNARQTWISLAAQMHTKKSDLKKAGISIRDLRMEGDIGDLTSPEIKLTSLEPLQYAPFTLEIQRLNLSKILLLIKSPHPSKALGDLGKFSGTAYIQDNENMEVLGVHRGLEFIFANRGQRETQAIREISGKLILRKNRWSLDVSQIIPDRGHFSGDIVFNADRDFKNMDFKLKSKKMNLSPSVIKLMTSGGAIGDLGGDIQVKFVEGKLSFLKGLFALESAEIDGVSVDKFRLQTDLVKNEYISSLQVQKLGLRAGSPSFQVVRDLVDPDWMMDNNLVFKNVTSQLRYSNLKSLVWKGFHAQIETNGARISSDGQWDDDGVLGGQLSAQVGKTIRRWDVRGVRDNPEFLPLVPDGKKGQ